MTNGQKILVTEDDPAISKAAKDVLEKAGYKVDVAVDGDEALEKIKNNTYSLIMLDLIMPKKTGFDVLHELQLLGDTTPALVFSNLFVEDNRKEALALGAKGYYVKSDMSVDDLVDVVKKHVQQHAQNGGE